MFNFVQAKGRRRYSADASLRATTDIHVVFRGLKSEPNAEIGQKGTFFKGLRC